jgi:hypothetical protein
MCKFQLAWLMHMRITVVLMQLGFPSRRRLKIEQRSVIKLCVKLKKTDIETFEMLKSVSCEKCLSRASVFAWHKKFKEGQEFLQDDEWVRTMLTAFFDAVIMNHECIMNLCQINRL